MPWWYAVYTPETAAETDAEWLDSIAAERDIDRILVNAGYPED